MDCDIHILGLRSRNLCPDNQILVLLDHVDRRGPPGVLCPLLLPCSPGDPTEHLVEQAVHLAQRVVEPAAPVSAHHGLYPLLSLSPATRGGIYMSRLYRLLRSIPNLLPRQLSRLRRTLFDSPGRVHLGCATQSEGENKQQHSEGQRVCPDQPHQRQQSSRCWYHYQ